MKCFIFTARSSVFATMFSSDFKEKTSAKSTIKDISPEAFLDFLNFLYTDSVKDIKSYLVELLAIADQYEVQKLKDLCEAELLLGLNAENAEDIFQYSHLYRCDKKLKEASFKLIKQ
jgi:hypothetical protein